MDTHHDFSGLWFRAIYLLKLKLLWATILVNPHRLHHLT
jgi:hypothetical protein